MENKNYIVLYLVSIGLSTTNNILTGQALSTGMFTELNPLGYNWVTIFLTILLYLFLLTPLFTNVKFHKRVFLIGIIYIISLSLFCFVHDVIVINL